MLGYFLVNLYTHHATKWDEGFQIVDAFVENMNTSLISGFSFNRYFGIGVLLAYIAMRFDFTDDDRGKKTAMGIAENLKSQGLIIGFSDWQPFNVTDDVKKGCEVATTVALAFRDWMNGHQDILQYFQQNKVPFMSRYLPALLQELDFKSSYESYPLSSNIIDSIRELTRSSANSCRSDIPKRPSIDFMERFIHHLMNCILVDTGREEPLIYNFIQHFSWLDSLISHEDV
jgi:hypothetical protein